MVGYVTTRLPPEMVTHTWPRGVFVFSYTKPTHCEPDKSQGARRLRDSELRSKKGDAPTEVIATAVARRIRQKDEKFIFALHNFVKRECVVLQIAKCQLKEKVGISISL